MREKEKQEEKTQQAQRARLVPLVFFLAPIELKNGKNVAT